MTRKRHILIVDDEPNIGLSLRLILEGEGYGITICDSVARFHIGNGARLEKIDWLGDLSPKGRRESAGIMVNYLYRLEDIEKNHEAYAEARTVVAANAVKRLARKPVELVPVAG